MIDVSFRLLTEADLARIFVCSKRSVQAMRHAGKLPAPVDPEAKSPRWHPDVVDAWCRGDRPTHDAPTRLRPVAS